MADAEAVVRKRRRLSAIWFVPAIAVALGLWMVVYTYLSEGPRVTIEFVTAEGIEAGKTKIKARSVEIGLVESVALSEDMSHVIVVAQLQNFAEPLLNEETNFWVVRARVGAGGVSGLGTILSGGYIELAPGQGAAHRRDFVGLENVPVTPAGTPGVKITVVSSRAGSLNVGDPVIYKGFTVGRVESDEFDVETETVRNDVFINAPYNDLVTTNTRFWNASGISFSATTEGIKVSLGSLESLVIGGLSFGLPEDLEPGERKIEGTLFKLYASEEEANESPNRHYAEYVVSFTQSVLGLNKGAPVRYRGIRVGTVQRIMIDEILDPEGGERGRPIPVLIRVEPGRFGLGDTPAGVGRIVEVVETAVGHGFRATLESGNLLTGNLYVGLDFHPEEAAAGIGEFAGRPTLPTIPGGLAQIEQKVAKLLDKLNAIPLEPTVASADRTLREVERTLSALRTLLASDATQQLPASIDAAIEQLRVVLQGFSMESPLYEDLSRAVNELNSTLQGVNDLSRTLDQRPSSLIFSRDRPNDPQPTAGKP